MDIYPDDIGSCRISSVGPICRLRFGQVRSTDPVCQPLTTCSTTPGCRVQGKRGAPRWIEVRARFVTSAMLTTHDGKPGGSPTDVALCHGNYWRLTLAFACLERVVGRRPRASWTAGSPDPPGTGWQVRCPWRA
jgi:hypothetical protein